MPFSRGRRPGELGGPAAHGTSAAAWVIDAAVMAGLRLGAASGALSEGDADRALAEAEQLLHRNPDDIDALVVVGRAAVRTGDGAMAAAALRRVLDARPELGECWALLSLALLLEADPDGAVEAAERATTESPEAPLGWHHLAVALERAGRPSEASAAALRAEALDPRTFARPTSWSDEEWTRALIAAREGLSPLVRDFYRGVPLRWASFPDVGLLRSSTPPLSPFIDALALPSAHGGTAPAAIVLYRDNLSRPSCTLAELSLRLELALQRRALEVIDAREEAEGEDG